MPADIANGIVFLASDDAGFMTGAGLVVDGGLTAQ
jgi:NAD(P)-dependent dehydrogenase (short-subunit alcohol dehydrogenase family)